MIAVEKDRSNGSSESPATVTVKTVAHERSVMLDCIRGVAIILVVVFHVATRYPDASLDSVALFFHNYGFLGVDIFFPLSGFLITRFLLTSTRPDFVRVFFLRRAFRILPLYYVAIAVYVLGALATGAGSGMIDRIWINIFFLTGWVSAVQGLESVPYSITWSLSVEEFAYLILGVMAWFNRDRLPLLLVIATIVAIALRIWMLSTGYGNPYYYPPARFDSIAIGGLTAVLLAHWPKWTVPALLIALVTSMAALGPSNYTSFGIGACICIALAEGPLRGMSNLPLRILAAIGFYSYFNYLFHLVALEIMMRFYGYLVGGLPSFWIATGLLLALMQAVAMISYKIFEAPLMRFGRKFEPAPSAIASGQPTTAGVAAT